MTESLTEAVKAYRNETPRQKQMYRILKFQRQTQTIWKKVFGIPSEVLVGGHLQIGKTDFSLLLSQVLSPPNEFGVGLNIVDKVASNTSTFGEYDEITDAQTLRFWLFKDKLRKLFIFDEGNIHLISRRAMSKQNVDFITLLPELSKSHAHFIIIGQRLEKIDSELRDFTWCKAVAKKVSKKKAYVSSRLLPKVYRISNIPKTTIKFDRYARAPFTMKPTAPAGLDDKEYQTLYKWAHGGTWKELFDHPQQANRFIRRKVRELLDMYSLFTQIAERT